MNRPQEETAVKPPAPDFEELSRNMARFVEEAGKATAAYSSRWSSRPSRRLPTRSARSCKTLGQVAESWLVDPQKTIEAQGRLGAQFFDLWGRDAAARAGRGGDARRPAGAAGQRFQDPEWTESPVFDFLKQAYLDHHALGRGHRRGGREPRRAHAAARRAST